MNREQAAGGRRQAACRAGGRSGFTLAEMLVTIVIIGILASIVLGALGAARTTARVARTKALIARLDAIILAQYDSYRTRRVPISTRGLKPLEAAQLRLIELRDLMRLEMPDRWNDVVAWNDTAQRYDPRPPIDFDPVNQKAIPLNRRITTPALARRYYRRFQTSWRALVPANPTQEQIDNAKKLLGRYGSAECLYQVVTAVDPNARELFGETDVGDADGDGLPEFVDGWGNPIKWLRWAPGFNDSDVQPNIMPPYRMEEGAAWEDADIVARGHEAAETDHDPFDTRRVDMSPDATDPDEPPRGWRLVPLIYSAGPDGIYDISTGGKNYVFTGYPHVFRDTSSSPPALKGIYVGLPVDSPNTSVTATGPANGSFDHYDNIHNHRIEAR